MGKRSKVDQLPEAIRKQVIRLVKDGVEYRDIEAKLDELGHPISKSSLHRWGSSFQERMKATADMYAQAEAYIAQAGTGTALDEAAHQMAVDLAIRTLMELGPNAFKEESPVKLLQAIGRLESAGVQRERLKMADRRARAEQVVKELDENPEVKKHLPLETRQKIREQIYGIVD